MLLDHKRMHLKRRTGVVGLGYAFDILNPDSGETIGVVREVTRGAAKGARLIVNNALLPVTIEVRETEDGPPVFTMHRSPYFFRPTFKLTDATGESIGRLRGGIVISRKLEVIDAQNAPIGKLNFKFAWTGELVNSEGTRFGGFTPRKGETLREKIALAGQYEIVVEQEIAGRNSTALFLLAGVIAWNVILRTRIRV